MSKRAVKTKSKPRTANSAVPVQNSLAEAVGYGGGGWGAGFPFSQGNPWTEQISNVNTLFKNLRWFLISNFRQLLCEIYVEIGLVQTIVDLPVDDALRGGVTITSKQLDEDEIKELQISLDRDDDLNIAGQAAKWNRLFGGAGILILTGDDPQEPLDISAITDDSPFEFRAVDMWELFWDKQNTEGYDPEIQTEDFEYYDYYAVQLHKSKVMRLKGLVAPSFIRPRLRGWGFSVVEKLVRSMNQYLKATDLGFEVLDEFKIDVYKVKNLVNSLTSPNGMQSIQQRIQLANWQKNYQNAIVMDSEDDYDHKQLSFAGLAETMAGIRMQVASDMRMPATKLFGQSVSGGIGNNDQNDMENYNSMVESEVRNKIKYDILRMVELKCQKLFGRIPDDIEIAFKPLRTLTSEQEENVKTQQFNRVMQAKSAGELTRYEFREACNKGNLLVIQLDNADDDLNPSDPDIATMVEGGDAGDETDIDDPGANREDTRKPRASGTKKDTRKPTSGKKANSDDWDESKHPRADDGKFGAGGGGKSQKSSVKVSKSEAQAIRYYTGALSSAFREADEGKSSDEMVVEKNNELNKFLKKAPKFKGDIYRAIAVEKENAEAILAKYEVGKTVERPKKESWSKDLEGVENRLISVAKGLDQPVKIYFEYPESQIGVDISEASSFPDEQEVLLPPDSKYKVVSVDQAEGGYKIIFGPAGDKKQNSEQELKVFTALQILERGQALLFKNSSAFDRASYAADGGDSWIDERRRPIFENPSNVDEALWAKAKEASQKAFGKEKWQFVTWFYKKQGGKFT